ncbi:MAG: MFS transporter [Bryobacteraceae bacterium]
MSLPPGITRNVFWLGLVSFFTDASSEMLYPIVPIFLTTTLGASPAIVGMIEGLAEATASLLKIWSGWLSDKLQVRRPLIFAGYGVSALTRPLLAIAYGWPMVLLARILDRFGKGMRGAPRDALLADSVEPEFRGRAFGFHRSMDQLGAVVGPLIGLALLAYLAGDYRTLFLFAFIPSAISVLVITFVRDIPAQTVRELPQLSFRNIDQRFRRFLLIVGLFALGNSSDVFLILRAKDIGMSTEQTIGLFIAFNVVYVLSAYPAGVLSDRIERRKVFAFGLLIFAVVYGGFAFATTPRRCGCCFRYMGFIWGSPGRPGR